jgi:hypothetical protein
MLLTYLRYRHTYPVDYIKGFHFYQKKYAMYVKLNLLEHIDCAMIKLNRYRLLFQESKPHIFKMTCFHRLKFCGIPLWAAKNGSPGLKGKFRHSSCYYFYASKRLFQIMFTYKILPFSVYFSQPNCISLQPEGMKSLSSTRKSTEEQPQRSAPLTSEISSLNAFSAKQAQADITESVSSIMAVSNKLEQDKMEGVDANEWVCNRWYISIIIRHFDLCNNKNNWNFLFLFQDD